MPWAPVRPLLLIAIVDGAAALLMAVLPWSRWHPRVTLVAVPVALGVAMYAEVNVDTGAGTLAFLAVLFTWVGLHHPPGTVMVAIALTLPAWLAALVSRGADEALLSTAVGAVIVLGLVGELVARLVNGLRAANETLRRTDAWRARLMAVLAHDIRAPLHVITGNLETLAEHGDRMDRATRDRLLVAARERAQRLGQLAVDLLDADRVSHGALRLDVEEFRVSEVIERAVSMIELEDVEVDVDSDLVVRADPGRVEQILVNLLVNAWRHGAPPIRIEARRTPRAVAVTVRDHGPGLREGIEGVVWRPSMTADTQSAGLGLWLMSSLVEAHGGTLVYRPAHPGAAFTVEFPVAPR